MKQTFLWIFVTLPLFGPFRDLAVTDDAAQVYFDTDLRLKSETMLTWSQGSAVYRMAGGQLERLSDLGPSNALQLYVSNPQVSGDGTKFAFTERVNCGGSSCQLTNAPKATSVLRVRNGDAQRLQGQAQISRNGRYVVAVDRYFFIPAPVNLRERRDLQTGEVVGLKVLPSNTRQTTTSQGRVLGFDPERLGTLSLWSPEKLEQVATVGVPETAIVDDSGTWVVYETNAGERGRELHSFSLQTKHDYVLASGASDGYKASISNDGNLVLFLESAGADGLQIRVKQTNGADYGRLAAIPEGVTDAVLAGYGAYAVAATAMGRLLRLELTTGNAEELIAATPSYYAAFSFLVPGSILPLRGTGLAPKSAVASTPLPVSLAGVQVLVDGKAMPVLSVSPAEIWFQVPFEMAESDRYLGVELISNSVFEGGPRNARRVSRLNPYFFGTSDLGLAHQDFRSSVSGDSPARPGEIVHAFGVGLGPVEPSVVTGVPSPVGTLARLREPFECKLRSESGFLLVQVPFDGLAPGLIGIYQVDIQLPDTLPSTFAFVLCGFPSDATKYHGGAFNTPVQ